jgi:hypothetical protein
MIGMFVVAVVEMLWDEMVQMKFVRKVDEAKAGDKQHTASIQLHAMHYHIQHPSALI